MRKIVVRKSRKKILHRCRKVKTMQQFATINKCKKASNFFEKLPQAQTRAGTHIHIQKYIVKICNIYRDRMIIIAKRSFIDLDSVNIGINTAQCLLV